MAIKVAWNEFHSMKKKRFVLKMTFLSSQYQLDFNGKNQTHFQKKIKPEKLIAMSV